MVPSVVFCSWRPSAQRFDMLCTHTEAPLDTVTGYLSYCWFSISKQPSHSFMSCAINTAFFFFFYQFFPFFTPFPQHLVMAVCENPIWAAVFEIGKTSYCTVKVTYSFFFTAILMLVWILADTLELNCVKTWIACITLPRRFERTVSSSGMRSTLKPLTVRFNHEITEFLMNIFIAVKDFEFWHVSNFEIRQPNKWDAWQLAVTCAALLELTSLY